jgi:ribosomal protein L37AE/L43A
MRPLIAEMKASYSNLSGNNTCAPSLVRMRTIDQQLETLGRSCAQCGADIIAPEWAEHLPDHRVRNVWSCEACGYQFEDTIYMSSEAMDAD